MNDQLNSLFKKNIQKDLNEYREILKIDEINESNSSYFHYRKINSEKLQIFEESKIIPLMNKIMKNTTNFISLKNNQQINETIWENPQIDLK